MTTEPFLAKKASPKKQPDKFIRMTIDIDSKEPMLGEVFWALEEALSKKGIVWLTVSQTMIKRCAKCHVEQDTGFLEMTEK